VSKPLKGIQWPVASDNERSSTETAKKIWARSFAELDKSLLSKLESERRREKRREKREERRDFLEC
jgi:hypothetical protein